ncbi:hypothetical protein [Streptomyces sp. NPDC048623]|uniref:RICIN domain-containing protein n=1 Tax=Streptomyces sp. NPDC048623 TaxID=3155761 RepID=UPI003415D44F
MGDPAPDPGVRGRLRRGLVGVIGVAGLVLAAVSVIALVLGGGPGHGDLVEGPVTIKALDSGLCLGERRGTGTGTGTGQVLQLACADAGVPSHSLERVGAPGDAHWRIVSRHPDRGPGCWGLPAGGRTPDAMLDDSTCGAPTRVETFTLHPYGTPPAGYRLTPAAPAPPDTCVTVGDEREAEGAGLVQAPCTPDAKGQVFVFERGE